MQAQLDVYTVVVHRLEEDGFDAALVQGDLHYRDTSDRIAGG